MPDNDEGRDPKAGNVNAQPGGRASRGPNPDPGGEEEAGGLVPPYDDRAGGDESSSQEARAASVGRQLSDTKGGRPGETVTPSDEQPVRPDEVSDRTPGSPKGVGKSTNRSGEDIAADEGKETGRQDAGTKGESQRPVGTSDERDSTAVDPQGSQGDAPNMPSGDQGG